MSEPPEQSLTAAGVTQSAVDHPVGDPAPADRSTKDKAADLAQTGKQAAGEVAQTASAAASDVVQETKKQAGDLYGKTTSQLSEQIVTQKAALVDTLRSLGDQLAAMTDHVEETGTAVDVASQARDRARSAADWLDGHEPNQVLDELRNLGRQQPGRFLAGALLAGVVAGRLTRGVVAAHTDDSTPTDEDVASTSSGTGQLGVAPAAGTGHHAEQPDTPSFGPAADSSIPSGFAPGSAPR